MFVTKKDLEKAVRAIHTRIDNSLANAHGRINETNADLRTMDGNIGEFVKFLAQKNAMTDRKLMVLLAERAAKAAVPVKVKKVATKTKKTK